MKPVGLILAVILGGQLDAYAAEPPALAHNPFARPPSERMLTAARRPGVDNDATSLLLTATIVAGGNRLANVDGRVLRPGDEVQGYRLLRVFEDRAVFEVNGRRMTIYVKPERVDDDE